MRDDFTTFRYPLSDVLPTVGQAAEYLHLDDEEHPGYVFLVEKLTELAASDLQAVGGYRRFAVDWLGIREGIIRLGGTDLTLDRQVAGYMRGATEAALFLCTAGEVFSTQYRSYNKTGDYLEAYITDAIGSLTVENAMDRVQDNLRTAVRAQAEGITTRYSPGYCNWRLTEQQTLFGLVGENPTGITLSDSCLMYPTKSVSGIIGIGKDVRARAYGCQTCSNKNCIYRRIVQNEK